MKLYYTMMNVGKVKYLLNYQDGVKTHNDGSPFWDIECFRNKRKFTKAINALKRQGYTERPFDYSFKKAETKGTQKSPFGIGS